MLQPAEVPEYMRPQWFFPLFAVAWFAVCALLSYLSGWRQLSARFADPRSIEGDRFRFVSASIGAIPLLPVNYSSCLFVTVGDAGLSMSLLFVFRFLSPTLHIPWSQVRSVQAKCRFFGNRTVVELRESNIKITLFGRAGRRALEVFSGQGARAL